MLLGFQHVCVRFADGHCKCVCQCEIHGTQASLLTCTQQKPNSFGSGTVF